jgi:hypothetical protein
VYVFLLSPARERAKPQRQPIPSPRGEGYGEERLKYDTSQEASRAMNRRAELKVQ